MKKFNLINNLAITFIIAFMILGCAATKEATKRPGWIDKGSGFFSGDRGKAFYGVGTASYITNVGLRREAADAGARTDLAKIFKTQIKNLVKIYAASIYGGRDREKEEQFVSSATKSFTEMELAGSMIIDRYYDEKEKTQYSLAVLDMNFFKDQVTRMKELSKEVQEAIKANAEKAFEELDRESERTR